MTSKLLPFVEVTTAEKPDAAVIWLHGLGADGHDFEPIASALNLPPSLKVRFIFPHAPVCPVTVNMGTRMRAWFDIVSLEKGGLRDKKGIFDSEEAVRKLIEREEELGISSERIILAGFSQGGVIALCTGIRYPRRLAGILSLSSLLPFADEILASASDENKKIPIFMAHGTMDHIVAFNYGQASYEVLKHSGYNVKLHTYPMDHSTCAEEIKDIANWISQVL